MATESWAEIMEDILNNGTWTNFRALTGVSANPKVLVLSRDDIRGKKTRIVLAEDSGNEKPVQTCNGKTIVITRKRGELAAPCSNSSHRNAVHDDIISILRAARQHKIWNIKRSTPQKDVSLLVMDIEILD